MSPVMFLRPTSRQISYRSSRNCLLISNSAAMRLQSKFWGNVEQSGTWLKWYGQFLVSSWKFMVLACTFFAPKSSRADRGIEIQWRKFMTEELEPLDSQLRLAQHRAGGTSQATNLCTSSLWFGTHFFEVFRLVRTNFAIGVCWTL